MKQFPALYRQGQKNVHFNWSRIIGWILNGIVASLVIFLANIYAVSATAYGETGDISHLGAITYTCVIWTVNCQIALIINHFTWIQHLSIWGSILLWYIFLSAYSFLPPMYSKSAYHILLEGIGSAPMYWMVTLVVVVVSLLPYFLHLAIQRTFCPMDDHVLQEMKCHCVTENEIWKREQQNSQQMTQIGFSARVDARVKAFTQQLNDSKNIVTRSVTNSPICKSLLTNRALF